MAHRRPKPVQYRRRREQKTNYSKRLSLLFSRKLRIVVRLTNNKVIAQLVQFSAQGDKIIMGLDSFALKKLGWNYSCKNFPAAYLTGLMFGKKVVEKGEKEAILDTGLKAPLKKGKVYAFLKGVLDAGLNVSHSEEILPEEERIQGKHIQDYAHKLKENEELYKKTFSQYLKNNNKPEEMINLFEQIKKKISN